MYRSEQQEFRDIWPSTLFTSPLSLLYFYMGKTFLRAREPKCCIVQLLHAQFQVPGKRHPICSGKSMDWMTLGQVATSKLIDCDMYEVGVTPFLAYTQIL